MTDARLFRKYVGEPVEYVEEDLSSLEISRR